MSETRPTHPTRSLFIHGLWIHSSAWEPWQELFHGRGLRNLGAGLAR